MAKQNNQGPRQRAPKVGKNQINTNKSGMFGKQMNPFWNNKKKGSDNIGKK